jgi:hypothetical protein
MGEGAGEGGPAEEGAPAAGEGANGGSGVGVGSKGGGLEQREIGVGVN